MLVRLLFQTGKDQMRGCRSCPAVRYGLSLLAACTVAAPAAAQDLGRPAFGVGYVASMPNMMAGGAAYVVLPVLGGLGLYVDAKFDVSDPTDRDNFDASLTATEVDDEIGDEFRDDESGWRAFNAAIVRPVTSALMLYGGLGYSEETVYREYFDDTGTRGLAGYYWVESTADGGSSMNVLAGMLLRMTPMFNAQFGVETAPRGVTVGVSVMFPR